MVAGMFPPSAAFRGGRWLGRLLRLLDPTHRRVAVKNLERSRGVCPPDEIPEFVDRVYENIGLTFAEMMMIPKLLDGLDNRVRLERFHVVDDVRRLGKGMITVIGHVGNWELIGLAVCAAGHPLHSLARPIENPWVDRYLNRFRTQTGQRIISKYEALGEMIRVIRKNEILIVQVDQDARSTGSTSTSSAAPPPPTGARRSCRSSTARRSWWRTSSGRTGFTTASSPTRSCPTRSGAVPIRSAR
jgi:KDO2-lipid IV(A) lauroyltransferase